jgi:hypothetical protein
VCGDGLSWEVAAYRRRTETAWVPKNHTMSAAGLHRPSIRPASNPRREPPNAALDAAYSDTASRRYREAKWWKHSASAGRRETAGFIHRRLSEWTVGQVFGRE